jgi:superoxide reductase
MLDNLTIYKCDVCGNIVEVMHGGKGKLKCCGSKMELMVENTVDAAKEKHVPVMEKIDGGVKIKLGEVAHPMEEEHYIEWIEILTGNKSYTCFLNPGYSPEAEFKTDVDADNIIARAYCNLHGHWKA